MTTTRDYRTDGWGELERLQAVRLRRPSFIRSGKVKRAPGGEWDWFYALPVGERASISRDHMDPDGMGADELATHLGTDVDSAMAQWNAARRLARGLGRWTAADEASEWDARAEMSCDTDDVVLPSDLMGPVEIASYLGCKVDTVYQWVTRGRLPEPWGVLSGTRLWKRADIETWANETGRRPTKRSRPTRRAG